MALDIFVKCLSKLPDTVSGDAFWYAEEGPRLWAMVVDGLGYGVEAAEPARLAVACIAEDVRRLQDTPNALDDPDPAMKDMLTRADQRLRSTRGAALGLAMFDAEKRQGRYAGIGNIELRILGAESHVHPICMPGIVGAGLRRVRVEQFAYSLGQLILMHSDGLSSRFDLDPYPSLTRPLDELGESLIAAHGKHDDLTLLLVRQHA